MDFESMIERGRTRYDAAATDVLRGNAAYGTGLAALAAGHDGDARVWLGRAGDDWRASWADASPTSWGRPIGVLKALLLAGDGAGAVEAAEWALALGTERAESPIGAYAAVLALLALGRFGEARPQAERIRGRDDFPEAVADALAAIAAPDAEAYARAAAAVLRSFEEREAYLEDVPVADTVLVLQRLAAGRGLAAALPASPLLP